MNMEYTSYKPIKLSGEEITDLVIQINLYSTVQ